MAPFSNYISFLFYTTLLLSLQINARDSQFFSKTTHFDSNNNVKETELLNNKEGPVNNPKQEPVFIPETDNSYGLYGHESGQLPPTTTNPAPYTTTTSYEPYKTKSEEEPSKYTTNKYYQYNKDAYDTNQNDMSNTRLTGTSYSNNNNNNYFNKDAYGDNQNEFGNSKYTEGEYNSMANQNNQKYYYNNNNAAKERYYYNNNNNAANERFYNNNNNAANNRYNDEKQGMSDTRFLEGGKYFHDVNTERYNPTLYSDSSRGVNHKNWYNNRGYFANNDAKSYENNNSMEGYQNQEKFEDDQDDFEP